jgi:hypothetical protein
MAPLRSRFPQKERCWPICRAAAGFLLELGGDLRAGNWFSTAACSSEEDAEALGREVAQKLLDAGAGRILQLAGRSVGQS